MNTTSHAGSRSPLGPAYPTETLKNSRRSRGGLASHAMPTIGPPKMRNTWLRPGCSCTRDDEGSRDDKDPANKRNTHGILMMIKVYEHVWTQNMMIWCIIIYLIEISNQQYLPEYAAHDSHVSLSQACVRCGWRLVEPSGSEFCPMFGVGFLVRLHWLKFQVLRIHDL